LIDFGFCYITPLFASRNRVTSPNRWQGGSLGFSNPYFWKTANIHDLSRRKLHNIDWYSVQAILYYAFTGECFPIASPAYRIISQPKNSERSRSFCNAVRDTMHNRAIGWFGDTEQNGRKINKIVDRLSNPDEFGENKKGWWQDTTSLIAQYINNFPLLLLLVLLVLGSAVSSSVDIGWRLLGMTLAVLGFTALVRIIPHNLGKTTIDHTFTIPIIPAVIGLILFYFGSNPDSLAAGFLIGMVVIFFTVILIGYVLKWGQELYAIFGLCLLGPLVIPPFAFSIIPICSGLLLKKRTHYSFYVLPAISVLVAWFASIFKPQEFIQGWLIETADIPIYIFGLVVILWICIAYLASRIYTRDKAFVSGSSACLLAITYPIFLALIIWLNLSMLNWIQLLFSSIVVLVLGFLMLSLHNHFKHQT